MTEWKVSLADVDLGQEEIAAVSQVLKSRWLTMGPVTEEFEEKAARYLGVKHAFAVTNGTAALHIAHQVLGIGIGDEVICPSLTFVATANSILYTGAKPVFADIIGMDNLNISPEDIEAKITPQTKAITVVHYGGYPCDMKKIIDIARRLKLFVIEDAAHAIGAEFEGKKCGAMGDIGCFSFFSNKNMTTGEGGMVVTNHDDLAKKIRVFRSHGMTALTWDRHRGHASSYDVTMLGYNYRIDEIRSAIGLVQLRSLESNNGKRRTLVKRYVEQLTDMKGIEIPFKTFRGNSAYHLFPIVLNTPKMNQPDMMAGLKSRGIQTSIHYPPVHLLDYYRKLLGYPKGSFPKTEEMAKKLVTLPLFPKMNNKQMDMVIHSVRALLGGVRHE
ncbi:MAG: DegT/DnrJ/EryC1/StrS family aminotransferase [Thermodesulfobacteriota bacterium]|nr:DegT/DnrJ/EryC1/StrS family aminotransferase [Thermodesulfobacteriota bacterium]